MAFIIEQAGGKSDSGGIATLDIVPTSFHQRAPIFIGSKENVDDYLAIRKACESKWIYWTLAMTKSISFNDNTFHIHCPVSMKNDVI